MSSSNYGKDFSDVMGYVNQEKDFREAMNELFSGGVGGFNLPHESDHWLRVPVCEDTHRVLTGEEIVRDNLDPCCFTFYKPNGEKAIDQAYYQPSGFYGGRAQVWLDRDGNKVGFIDEQGEVVFVLGRECREATSFIAGLALVHYADGSYGYINTLGERIKTN